MQREILNYWTNAVIWFGEAETVKDALAKCADRFWSKVEKSAGCWLWTAGRHGNGYGCFKLLGQIRPAHRIAFRLAVGPIPDGLMVLHRCDTPLCCRPDHLFLGTNRDNMKDCASKGRIRFPGLTGESHPQAKLTASQVADVRQSKASSYRLASELGVSPKTIQNIRSGKKWSAVIEAS